jgi:hypothetical protein
VSGSKEVLIATEDRLLREALAFPLKVFQSVLERAPATDVLAKPKERACVDRERPLAVPIVTGLWLP